MALRMLRDVWRAPKIQTSTFKVTKSNSSRTKKSRLSTCKSIIQSTRWKMCLPNSISNNRPMAQILFRSNQQRIGQLRAILPRLRLLLVSTITAWYPTSIRKLALLARLVWQSRFRMCITHREAPSSTIITSLTTRGSDSHRIHRAV